LLRKQQGFIIDGLSLACSCDGQKQKSPYLRRRRNKAFSLLSNPAAHNFVQSIQLAVSVKYT